MSSNPSLKNYYKILGVQENASLFEIESAYEKLASAWHPDKHKEHRKSAEIKFQEIAEAFEVLSDRNKRSHYDELLNKHSSLEEANATFQNFFNEHGIRDEQEDKFFNQHYPDPLNSYYKILGVSKSATLDEIKNAYRKLALKYHPKNNPNDQTAKAKFIEINEAFNALSNEHRRQNYDRILFGQIAPIRAHNIFDDFFSTRLTNFDDDFFGPWFQRKWTRDLDHLMIDEKDERIKNGETIKTSSVWSNKNGQESRKVVTTKRSVNDGKTTEEVTEDYLYPSGERKIVKTRNADGKIERKNYTLKKGEQLPKELTE